MRKLMEAVQLNEAFSDQDPTQLKSEEDFFNRIIALTDEGDELLDSNKQIGQKFRVLDQILQDISNITRLRQAGRDYVDVEEAYQGGKTEHSGAKKGKGAYYGRKKEAKRDSNKNRRKADKAQTKDISEVTTEDGTTYSLGTVEVTVFDDEVSLKHGHGQNLFLSREEFSDFIRGVAHNRLGEGLEENFNPRESTVALHELMDEGILDARTVADACLNYMSEAEVDDMASDNSFFGDE